MIFSDTREWNLIPKSPFHKLTTERIYMIVTRIVQRVNEYIIQTGNPYNKVTISPEIFALVQTSYFMKSYWKQGTSSSQKDQCVGMLGGTIPVYVDVNLEAELFYIENHEETEYKPMAGRFVGIKELEGELFNGEVHSGDW